MMNLGILKKGALHKALGIPLSTKIPISRLQTAKNSKNAHIRKMASLALSMRSWKH